MEEESNLDVNNNPLSSLNKSQPIGNADHIPNEPEVIHPDETSLFENEAGSGRDTSISTTLSGTQKVHSMTKFWDAPSLYEYYSSTQYIGSESESNHGSRTTRTQDNEDGNEISESDSTFSICSTAGSAEGHQEILSGYLASGEEDEREMDGGYYTNNGNNFTGSILTPTAITGGWPSNFDQKIYDIIFTHTSGTDLLSCRLVSKNWRYFSSFHMPSKTALVFNGAVENDPCLASQIPKFSTNLLNYIQTSSTKFNLWTTVCMNSICSTQLEVILGLPASVQSTFQFSISHINTLQFDYCFIDWKTFYEILRLFTSLTKLQVKTSIFYKKQHQSSASSGADFNNNDGSKKYWTNVLLEQESVNDQDQFQYKSTKPKLKLKSLIVYDTNFDSHTSTLIFLLAEVIQHGSLENFEVHLGTAMISGDDDSTRRMPVPELVLQSEVPMNENGSTGISSMRVLDLWIAIGELLLQFQDSLQFIAIRCQSPNAPINSFDQFLTCCVVPLVRSSQENLLSSQSSRRLESTKSPLKRFILDFKYLWLSHPTFASALIPFIRKQQQLELLEIKIIVLKPPWIDRMERLLPINSPNCKFNIGVHISQLDGLPSIIFPLIQCMTSSSFYRKYMKELYVSIFSEYTDGLSQMIAKWTSSDLSQLKKLAITIGNQNFIDYNIALVVNNYPNLTELDIGDGPSIKYTTKKNPWPNQYFIMTRAMIYNEDVQLIIRDLKRLRKLRIVANMCRLTNTALTGLNTETCERLLGERLLGTIVNLPSDLTGLPISNMQCLESLNLQGIGPKVTDATGFFAFHNMPKLKEIKLFGTLVMSDAARFYLRNLFPKSKGCSLQIIPFSRLV